MPPADRFQRSRRVAELLHGVEGIDWHGDAPPLAADAPLSLVRFLGLAERMARLVARLHEHGVTHGDLRPEHFRLHDGELLITGFGHAVTFETDQGGFAPLDRLPSDITYLAPEQTGRMNRSVDYRADLYALGGTLYCLATGHPPFPGRDRSALVHAHLAEEPRPPGELAPWMPPAVSHVLLRLLAKEPDERYQSACGLADDLGLLRATADGGGPLDRVPLRAAERVLLPRTPRRLHGRARPLGELLAAFDAVARGGSERLFLAGEAGVGKTLLVNELQRPVALRAGRFVRGKCEQFQRDRPLLAPVQALRQLLTLLGGEPEKTIHEMIPRLRAGFGPDAGALLDVLPELTLLTGDLPPPAPLDPSKAQRRLTELLVRLVGLVASPSQPFVLVLDDLQWADQSTLNFVTALMEDDTLDGVLFVGLFRREELHDVPALRCVTEKLSSAVIHLENLGPDEVSLLVGEMLGVPAEEVRELSTHVHRATQGNPFHAIELVHSLHREGTVHFDHSLARWTWDAAALTVHPPSVNVVEFLARTLSAFPPPTSDALASAACLGADLTLDLLALATARAPEETAAVLLPALERGVLVTPDAADFTRGDGVARISFCHDRMQQAAACLRDESWRSRRHLEIARRFYDPSAGPGVRQRAAGHYAEACDLLADAEEKRRAASAFLEAARHARTTGSFAAARRFLRLALELLGPDPWACAPSLAWDLHEELHVVCYCLPDHPAADAAFAALRGHAAAASQLALAASIQVMSLSNRTHYEEAIQLGAGLLRELGIAVPLDAPEPDFRIALNRLYESIEAGGLQRLPGRGCGSLENSPAARLLNRMVPAAFFCRPHVANWLVVHAARWWLAGTYDDTLLYPMACLSLATIPAREDYATGYQAARAALSAGEAGECGVETARARHVFGLFNCHWFEPLEHCLTQAREAHESLRLCGELEFACYTFFTSQAALLDICQHLADLDAENRRAVDFAATTGNRHAAESYAAFRGLIDSLIGKPPAEVDDVPTANPMAACFHHTTRAVAACLFGDDDAHIRHADAAVRLAAYITGFYPTALINVLDSLALLARQRGGDRDPAIAKRLTANQAWLASRGSDAPVNFSHLHDLVEAERMSAEGRGTEALALYERAIRRAKAHRRPWHAAIATEKAARCYLALGLEQAGYRLLERARTLYAEWGATGKCGALAAEFPFLQTVPLGFRDAQPLIAGMQQLATLRSVPQLAAATAELLQNLSGATDGQILAQDENNQWMLKAGFSAEGPPAYQSMEEAERRGLTPATVVRLGLRHMQTVLSDDAAQDPRFMGDPRFRDLERCAVLGVPVISRNRVVAFVVLENRRLRGAFTKAMAEMVEAFCGHLAVSIDNARLYQSLETQVEQRTRELRTAEESLARAAFELTANIPIGTYVLERDSSGEPRFTFVSERWLQMLDLRREDVLADHSLAMNAVHPDDREAFTRRNAEVFADNTHFQWEGRIVARGQTRWVTIESVPRPHPGGGTIWEGVMIDITEEKEAALSAQVLRETHRRELETKLKTSLAAAAVAHEINQPLSAILLQSKMALEQVGGDNRPLQVIAEEAQRVVKTIDKMKTLLRNVQTEHTAIDLVEVVKSTLLYSKELLALQRITARTEGLDRNCPITGDSAQLQFALTNLIRNAAEAIAEHNPAQREIAIELRRPKNSVELVVGDSGPGWDGNEPGELPLTTTKTSGTGIGLYVVRTAMQNHRGHVVFGHSPLGGAEVRLVFPAT